MTATIDLSHLIFIDLIRSITETSGPQVAKGNLMRIALNLGKGVEKQDFATFDDLIAAINEGSTSLAKLEGKATYLGDGLVGLPACPFGKLTETYKEYFATDLEGFEELVKEFNAPGRMAKQLKIGMGAGVGPFCIFHQPMRSQIASSLSVAGKPVEIFQLACCNSKGECAYADELIAEFGCSRVAVEQAMENNVCCYGIRSKA